MFGLLRPALHQLDGAERRRYASCYCNLCGALSIEYGVASRLLVVHDIATLAWLLAPVDAPKLPLATLNCLRGGTRAVKQEGLSNYVRFLAAISAFTLGVKLRDDDRDGGTWRSRLGRRAYHQTFERARLNLSDLNCEMTRLHSALAEQDEIEAALVGRFPEAATPTGEAYAAVAGEIVRLGGTSLAPEEAQSVGNALGQAVYLIDAVRDYRKDLGRSYNPLCIEAGRAVKRLPNELRHAVTSFVEDELLRASNIFRRMDVSFHRRWNAVVDQLLGSLQRRPRGVTLHSMCFIPCEFGVAAISDDDCAKAASCCVCCVICGINLC